MTLRILVGTLLLLLFGLGCTDREAPPELGPPDGWTGTETRWWRDGVDTSGVFRNLETLADMGVAGSEVTYVASGQLAQQAGTTQRRFEAAVKQSLIELYRNQPALVDSLFETHVKPQLQNVVTTGSMREQVDRQKSKVYKVLRSHFQEPRTALILGRDINVVYPDSLRTRGVGGKVHTQVYLNEEGKPQAVQLLEGVHPVLDDLAMKATTQMEWRPAYRMRNGNWVAISGWARFSVNFRGE